MQATQLLVDWVQRLARDVRKEVGPLSPAELEWRPDPGANSIGLTVWHFSRWLDLLTVRALENRPAGEEQWFTRGWAARTGYDPRGLGAEGFGALTGYTRDEARAVPPLAVHDLLCYLDQVCAALCDHLRGLPEGTLDQPAPGFGESRTRYRWLTPILMGCLGHLGEIECLKAMYLRTVVGAAVAGAAPAAEGGRSAS
jgi:hypothetical protein